MAIASAQNPDGTLFPHSIALAISCRVLFFLSTTPFCWGVLGAAYRCLIPWLWQNLSNSSFWNSPPWSLLICTMPPFSCLSCKAKIRKLSNASDLFLRKSTHVYLEKSSTMTKMYFFPAMLSGVIGPMRSMCTSSSIPLDLISEICLCWTFTCLPWQHPPHTVSVCFSSSGIPLTTSALIKRVRPLVFICPSFLCHRSNLDSLAE